MSDAPSELVEPHPVRGWYQDPEDARIERWWAGSEWSGYTHRAASLRRSMLGPEYARAFWAGPNRAAARGLLFGRIAVIAFLAAFIVVLVIAQSGVGAVHILGLIFAVLLAAALVLSIVGIVNGILGIRAAKNNGGLALAVWGLCASAVILVITIALVAGVLIAVFRS